MCMHIPIEWIDALVLKLEIFGCSVNCYLINRHIDADKYLIFAQIVQVAQYL